MTISANVGGAWKGAAPKVNVGGAWKASDAWVRAGGLWYQASANGLKVTIDSATTLYDFNLKTYLQGAGLWPASGPLVIDELTITARTRITQNVGDSVVDNEVNYNVSTPYRTLPRGYKGITIFADNTYVFSNTQEDTALYPAFTTGDGWPTGSKINRIVVEGLIYGKGADGLGNPQTYYGQWRTSAGQQGADVTVWAILSGFLGIGLRHGWDAMKLTVPVGRIEGSGTVGGGGAAATTMGVQLAKSPTSSAMTSTVPLANWPKRLTMEWWHNGNVQRYDANNVAQVCRYWPVGCFMPTAALGSDGVWNLFGQQLFTTGFHGGGGGQGGGKGSRGWQHPIFATGTYNTGRAPLNGGDGTLTAPGTSSAAPIQWYSSDSKYGGGNAHQFDAVPTAGAFGEKPTIPNAKVSASAAGAGYSAVPPTAVHTHAQEGSIDAWTRVFASQPGRAVLGGGFLGSYNAATLKGAVE